MESEAGPGLHTGSAGFWSYLDRLVAGSPVVIDRPAGTAHPRYPSLVYPLDYGYLDNTTTVDGGGIDVWRGSLPEGRLDALVLTVDLEKRDSELKLLLGCTFAEQQTILDFLNGNSMRAILIERARQEKAEDQATHPGLELLRQRKSVRRFQEEPVPRELVEQVLEAATWAPSAHNRQPWRFAVLDAPGPKARLAEQMGADFRRDLLADGIHPEQADAQVERSRQRIVQAPVVIVASLDRTVEDVYPDTGRQAAERQMTAQGVAMAGQNLLLAAGALGLGAVWVCAPLFAPETVRRTLDLPDNWIPQGMVLLGYPAKTPPRRPRLPLAEVVRFISE